jgi:hypothetical protein
MRDLPVGRQSRHLDIGTQTTPVPTLDGDAFLDTGFSRRDREEKTLVLRRAEHYNMHARSRSNDRSSGVATRLFSIATMSVLTSQGELPKAVSCLRMQLSHIDDHSCGRQKAQ